MNRTARIPRTEAEAWGPGRYPNRWPITGPFRREGNGRIRSLLVAVVAGVVLGLMVGVSL
ncbi:MAG: hypothetical protein LW712_11240 [Burkholderiaceae bacterium]|jgi:hypothetical protein|nr:hypothetical protein [Burkholderiaceae bacterium]